MDYEQVASDVLPQPVKERIEQAGFRPYLLQATPSVNDALLCATVRRRQVDSGPSQAERPATPVDPFGFDVQSLLCELPELVGDIVGLGRKVLVERVSAALESSASPGANPVAVLNGAPSGIGKHAIAVAALERLGKGGVEVPMSRVLDCERMMQSSGEVLLALWQYLVDDERVPIFSEAELLLGLEPQTRNYILHEIARLPRSALLLAELPTERFREVAGVVPFECPGLSSQEARDLVAVHFGADVGVSGPAMDAVLKQATQSGQVVAGRLLYLLRFAQAIATENDDTTGFVSPDELAAAISRTARTWIEESNTDRKRGWCV